MSDLTSGPDIPAGVLDQAFAWAVRLSSGEADGGEREAFSEWLARSPGHRAAWARLEAVEQEFAPARALGARGVETLERAAHQHRRRRRQALGAGGLLSLVLLVGLMFGTTPVWQVWQAQYATAGGETQRIGLPGGAFVVLDGDTALDLRHGPEGPVLRLYRGRILVDSADLTGRDRPRVWTPQARLVPVGTRWVVATRDGATEVSVAQGRVDLHPRGGGEPHRVDAGERWRVATHGARRLPPLGITPGGWTQGLLEVDDGRLGDVLDALRPYHRGWLQYDEDIAGIRVTGVFRLDDTDTALRALEETLPLEVARFTSWWVRVGAR